MKRAHTIDINEVEKWYTITEDGMVWSKIKGRWMKPRQNKYGYVFYSIARGTGVEYAIGAFAHTLVALKHIGPPPTEKHEIDHLDNDKQNNHWSNLCWRTHAENIRESYRRGRRGVWLDRKKPSPTLATRMLISDAKKKGVRYTLNGHDSVYDSIETASRELGTYRKKIYNCIKNNKCFGGGWLSYISEEFSTAAPAIKLQNDIAKIV